MDVHTSFKETNKHMLEEQLDCDISFVLSSPEGSDVHIQAHRYMVISRSPVFRAMLCGPLKVKENHIRVEDIDPQAFKEILR